MSLNQKMTVKVTENSKAKARNSAAAMFLTDMYASQDVVHVSVPVMWSVCVCAVLCAPFDRQKVLSSQLVAKSTPLGGRLL